jgi:hypothetical protein
VPVHQLPRLELTVFGATYTVKLQREMKEALTELRVSQEVRLCN